jgi:hypothetical protein
VRHTPIVILWLDRPEGKLSSDEPKKNAGKARRDMLSTNWRGNKSWMGAGTAVCYRATFGIAKPTTQIGGGGWAVVLLVC